MLAAARREISDVLGYTHELPESPTFIHGPGSSRRCDEKLVRARLLLPDGSTRVRDNGQISKVKRCCARECLTDLCQPPSEPDFTGPCAWRHALHERCANEADVNTFLKALWRKDSSLTVCGYPVCLIGFELACGFGHKRRVETRSAVFGRADGRPAPCSGKRKARSSAHGDLAVAWLGKLKQEEGKILPAQRFYSNHLGTEDLVVTELPMGLKRNYYETYASDAPDPISYPWFLDLWRTEFPGLKVRKLEKRGHIGHCHTCASFSINLENAQTEADRKCWLAALEEHRKWHKGSRMAFNELVLASSLRTKSGGVFNEIVIVADAMDQGKLRIPHCSRAASKTYRQMDKPQLRLFAVLVPGHLEWYGVVEPDVKHGSNITMTCLHRALSALVKTGLDLRSIGKVSVVLDNAGGENKNQWILSWCASLVGQGLFGQLFCQFMVVGHTHNLPDQRFAIVCATQEHSAMSVLPMTSTNG